MNFFCADTLLLKISLLNIYKTYLVIIKQQKFQILLIKVKKIISKGKKS